MKIRKVIVPALLIPFFFSCSEKNYSEFTDMPIIESYLRPGHCITMSVSRQIPFSEGVNYSDDDINNLVITVKCNGTSHILTPLGDGQYTDNSLIVEEGQRYEMSFSFDSRTVSAYTDVPAKPSGFIQSATSILVMRMDSLSGPPQGGSWQMPVPVTLEWNNDDQTYYIMVVENMEETLDPVRDFGDDDRPEARFRKAPTTASGVEMRPQEFQYFGKHRLILYHVLPDYASLYNETSSSSQNLTNPSTSIMNGYGIFTGLNADTLYLDVLEAKK